MLNSKIIKTLSNVECWSKASHFCGQNVLPCIRKLDCQIICPSSRYFLKYQMIVIETSMQNDLKTTIERVHWTFELSNFVSLALTITLTRSVDQTDSLVCYCILLEQKRYCSIVHLVLLFFPLFDNNKFNECCCKSWIHVIALRHHWSFISQIRIFTTSMYSVHIQLNTRSKNSKKCFSTVRS